MVRIGIIGLGFMGKTHFEAVPRVEGARVEAICTRSEKKLAGDWTDIQGNFGDRGGVVDLSGVRTYREMDGILSDPDIDLVDVCLPTRLHREASLAAFRAGKHVLLEKPIAVRLAEADEMVEAADKSGCHFMVGQVLRFFPEFAYVKSTMDAGVYGALVGANFKRVISRPRWGDDWFSDLESSGGPGIDLHIHDADFVRFLVGTPDAVFSSGILADTEFAQYIATHYLYEELGLTITAQSGAIAMGGRPFEHGFDVYFERGTLQYNSSSGKPLALVTEEGIVEPEVHPGDAFAREIQVAVDAVRGSGRADVLSGQSARDSLELCWREMESIRSGKLVRITGR